MEVSTDLEKKENGEGKITIATSRFGEITADTRLIVRMTSPFPGFPESNNFVILPHKKESVFMWLQSLDNPDLAFVVIQAGQLIPDYHPPIPALIRKELEFDQESHPEILLMLTIPPGRPREMTANLMGPVIINSRKRLAKQLILDQGNFDPCWPVFQDS